jgi:hypothetical protein
MAVVPESATIVNALRSGLVPNQGLEHFATGPRPAGRGGERGARLRRDRQGPLEVDSRRVRDRQDLRRALPVRAARAAGSRRPRCRSRSTTRRCITSRRCTAASSSGSRPRPTAPTPSRRSSRLALPSRRRGHAPARHHEDDPGFADATEQRLEDKLADLSKRNPAFAQVLRAYHRATHEGDFATAQGLLAWLAGQPHTDRSVLRTAGTKGKVDGQAALTFLAGLLQLLRQSGYGGLVVVLDEVETIQRMNAQTREKSLNALRQLMDMLAKEELPGLYLVVTGTRDFFEGYKGLKGLAPLYQRVQVKFGDDRASTTSARPGAPPALHDERLLTVGRACATSTRRRTRSGSPNASTIDSCARSSSQSRRASGARSRLAPRLFLRELIDVLDRVDIHPDYDPA